MLLVGPLTHSCNTTGQVFQSALAAVETDVKADSDIFPSEAQSSTITQETPISCNTTMTMGDALYSFDDSGDSCCYGLYITSESDDATSPPSPQLAEVIMATVPKSNCTSTISPPLTIDRTFSATSAVLPTYKPLTRSFPIFPVRRSCPYRRAR